MENNNELKLYKIPAIDNRNPEIIDNVASVSGNTISSGIPTPTVPQINGLNEQQVRDIFTSMSRFQSGTNVLMDGYLKSQNFYTGVSGWQIDADGNCEFGDGIFRGTITATAGTIGGWTINATTIASTNITLNSSTSIITIGSSNGIIIDGPNHKITSSDGTTWILNGDGTVTLPATFFIAQDIPLETGSLAGSEAPWTASDPADSSVLFVAEAFGGSSLRLWRLKKDSITGNYYKTHTTNLNNLNTSTYSTVGIAVAGSYLYVTFVHSTGPTNSIRRYDKADLANVTTITYSGTEQVGPMWSDTTNLYIKRTTDIWVKFTISGTVATNAGDVTFTSAGGSQASATSNGTNVWVNDVGTGAITIRKYPIAGGSATSSLSLIISQDAIYDNSGFIGLFIGGSSILGIGYGINWTSPTVATGFGIHLLGITLP